MNKYGQNKSSVTIQLNLMKPGSQKNSPNVYSTGL